jgi:cytoskeletal protein RodZ
MLLEQIGQKLKAARETQGLSLRQIHERTKIPVAHLQAIDAGLPEDLPEVIYVCNYIRRYGDCVGLPGQALADEYRRESELVTANKASSRAQQQHTAPVYVSPKYLEAARIDRSPPNFKTYFFPAIWIVLVLFLLTYVVMGQINNRDNQQDPSINALRESASKANLAQIQTNNLVTTATSAPAAAPASNTGMTRLSLSANQHVWVEVKSTATGESLFNGYLEQGDRRDFEDAQGLRIRAGNAGSLTVSYDGKVESFGDAGKIGERVFGNQTPTATAASPTDNKTTAVVVSTTKPVVKKTTPAHSTTGLANSEGHYRRLDDMGGYGDTGSSTRRSSDVPYRYSDGRLDND